MGTIAHLEAFRQFTRAAALALALLVTLPASGAPVRAVVAADAAPVHETPGGSATARLGRGTSVTVHESRYIRGAMPGAWSRITGPKGVRGWVLTAQLTLRPRHQAKPPGDQPVDAVPAAGLPIYDMELRCHHATRTGGFVSCDVETIVSVGPASGPVVCLVALLWVDRQGRDHRQVAYAGIRPAPAPPVQGRAAVTLAYHFEAEAAAVLVDSQRCWRRALPARTPEGPPRQRHRSG